MTPKPKTQWPEEAVEKLVSMLKDWGGGWDTDNATTAVEGFLDALTPYVPQHSGNDQQGKGAIPEYTIARCTVHRVELETRPHDFAICPECGDFPPSIEHVIVVARADLQATPQHSVGLSEEERGVLREIAAALASTHQPTAAAFLRDLAERGESTEKAGLAQALREFDAWLSFRGEFREVLLAFRKAFGTDTGDPCPNAPVCQNCISSHEDGVCLPHERAAAERGGERCCCGHTRKWHGHGGAGGCEASPTCGCKRFLAEGGLAVERLADEAVKFAHDKMHDPEGADPSAMNAATDCALTEPQCSGCGRFAVNCVCTNLAEHPASPNTGLEARISELEGKLEDQGQEAQRFERQWVEAEKKVVDRDLLIAGLEAGLEGIETFIESVRDWTGNHPDERDETLETVRALLSKYRAGGKQ
jgi:hypothetical protein